MSESNAQLPVPGSFSATAPATLILDPQGGIQLANLAAGALWQAEPFRLRGQSLADLFVFEVQSDDPDFLAVQCEALLEGGQSAAGVIIDARLPSGDTRAVRLRCEAIARQEGFIATIAPAPVASSAVLGVGSTDTTGSAPTAALATLLQHCPLGFFDLNFSARTIHYSAGWKRQLGYAEHELEDVYETWLRLIHPEDSAAAPDQVGRRPAGRQRTFDIEYRLKHRRDHWVWLHGTGVQLFSPSGELERVVGIQLDITERKELEEEALIAEDRWRALTEEGSIATFDLDFNTGAVWVSAAWLTLSGRRSPPADPADFATSFPDLAASGLAAALAEQSDEDGAFSFVSTLARPGAEPRPVCLSGSCTRLRRGEITRVSGITLHLPANLARATRGPEALALSAFDSLQEAVILADARANVLHMNAPALRLTGLSPERVSGSKIGEVFRLVHVRDGSSAEDAIDIALAETHEPTLTTDHALSPVGGGTAVPIAWLTRHLTDPDGTAAGVAIIFRDPQEMTLTPEELIRTNRFDSLGLLAGAIAHDFNNLLTTILGGISQAKDNRDYANLGDAEEACMAAKSLTRQLLAFAKGSPAGSLTVVKSPELLRDAVRVASAGSSVKIHYELDETCEPIEVDKGQILQVFQNLIVNAVQAMPDPEKGRIWLRCHPLRLAADQLPPLPAGDYVQFDIQDNGSGIAPENIDKIFEPFFTTKKTGTGLGLATVLSIVRKHGGQLGVDSTVGTGTTFSVFLPATKRTVQAEARQAPKLRFGTGRILFMDDDPKISEITANMLQSLDYSYDLAVHGEEALALYRKYLNVNRPYDAVIMDLTIIGGMGGEACFHELKKLDPDVRAIISSGYDNDEMVERFMAMGFCGYLTKPYRVVDLGRMLKTVLGG